MSDFPSASLNFLDKAINAVAPVWGRQRIAARLGLNALAASGFITPDSDDRAMRGWNAAPNHVDLDTIPSLPGARAGSRDLWMNTPIAVAALKRVRTNVVGFGLSLQSQVDRKFLGLSDKEADAWEANVEREFALWAESQECDVRRTSNFYDMQSIALMSTLMSGDCFVLLPEVKRPNMPYNLRIQLLEADFVSNPPLEMETASFSGGIKTDRWGAPTHYYVRTIPRNQTIFSSTFSGQMHLGEWKAIPAFGDKSGRRNVLHLFEVDRPGQRRGVPFLAPVLKTLKQLTRLSEAELMAAVVTSYLTVFVKDVPSQSPFNPGFMPGQSPLDPAAVKGSSTLTTAQRPADKNLYALGSGSIAQLAKNQEVQVVDPKRPNALFENFFNAMCKQLGASLEIPFEQLLLVFGSSYSASRAALLEAWKFYRKQRVWMARNFCNPIYQEWLTEAVISGRISAPGFLEDPAYRAAWSGAEWNGPGQGQIDPLKETQAALERIAGNLSTHEKESIAIDGSEWAGNVRRLAREKDTLEELGLEMVTSSMAPKAPIDGDGDGESGEGKPKPKAKEEDD